jgi:hypothetical protein
VLSQLSKSEKSKSELEGQLAEALKTLADLKEASSKQSSLKEKLQVG